MFLLLKNIENLAKIVFSLKKKVSYFVVKKYFLLDSNDAICLAKSNIISGLKEETAQVRKLIKGGNYSKEETINHLEVLTAETIHRRKLYEEI